MPSVQILKALKGEQLQCVPPPSEVLKQMFSEGNHEDKVEQASIRTLVLPTLGMCLGYMNFLCSFLLQEVERTAYRQCAKLAKHAHSVLPLMFQIWRMTNGILPRRISCDPSAEVQ